MVEPLSYICPTCGREVRVGGVCAGCAGKSRKPRPRPKRKSWEEDGHVDGLDLPDDDFDYQDFIAREFGKSPHRRTGVKWYWWCLGVLLLVLLSAAVLRGFF